MHSTFGAALEEWRGAGGSVSWHWGLGAVSWRGISPFWQQGGRIRRGE